MYTNDHIMYIQGLLLALNGLDIMVTLSVYVEYIKVLCKIFIKYMGTILQVYYNFLILLPKMIRNDFYYYHII
jgi:hypothetical protein